MKIGDAEAVTSSALNYTIVADDVDKTLTISAATPSGDAVGTPVSGIARSKTSSAQFSSMTESIFGVYKKTDGFKNGIPAVLASFGAITIAPGADNSVAVSGQLEYITKWTGFNSAVTDEQSGYYLPLQFAVPSDVTNYTAVTVKTANPDSANSSKDFGYADFDPAIGESSSDSNPKTVFSAFFYVKSTETVKTITIDWDGAGKEYEETTYTLDLSGLTLAEKPSGTTE